MSNIFAATRYGLGLAWKVVVVVEMFGTSNGVGYQVMKSYQVFNMEGVIAWTLTFVVAMIIIEYGIINLRRAPAHRLAAEDRRVEALDGGISSSKDIEKWFRREDGQPFKVIDRSPFKPKKARSPF